MIRLISVAFNVQLLLTKSPTKIKVISNDWPELVSMYLCICHTPARHSYQYITVTTGLDTLQV